MRARHLGIRACCNVLQKRIRTEPHHSVLSTPSRTRVQDLSRAHSFSLNRDIDLFGIRTFGSQSDSYLSQNLPEMYSLSCKLYTPTRYLHHPKIRIFRRRDLHLRTLNVEKQHCLPSKASTQRLSSHSLDLDLGVW